MAFQAPGFSAFSGVFGVVCWLRDYPGVFSGDRRIAGDVNNLFKLELWIELLQEFGMSSNLAMQPALSFHLQKIEKKKKFKGKMKYFVM